MKKAKTIGYAILWFILTAFAAAVFAKLVWGNPGECQYDLGPCIKSYIFSKTIMRAAILASFISAACIKVNIKTRFLIWIIPLAMSVLFSFVFLGYFLGVLEADNPYAAIGAPALASDSTLHALGVLINCLSWIGSLVGGIGLLFFLPKRPKNWLRIRA